MSTDVLLFKIQQALEMKWNWVFISLRWFRFLYVWHNPYRPSDQAVVLHETDQNNKTKLFDWGTLTVSAGFRTHDGILSKTILIIKKGTEGLMQKYQIIIIIIPQKLLYFCRQILISLRTHQTKVKGFQKTACGFSHFSKKGEKQENSACAAERRSHPCWCWTETGRTCESKH